MGKPLEDTYNLDLWGKRTVGYGVAISPSIAAQMANMDPKKDKKQLDVLAEQALVAAKGDQAANLGTELHRVVERLNLGTWTIDDVPEMFKADAEAYLSTLQRHGLNVVDGMAEVRVVNDIVRAAGTFDLILSDGNINYTSDLKTGQSIELAQVGIAVQLATYKHGVRYDVHTDERSDLPPTDADTALVIHLPYGSASCTIVECDIVKGWEAAQLAATAKSWNHRKDLFTPKAEPETDSKPQRITPQKKAKQLPDDGPPVDDTKIQALRDRVMADPLTAAKVTEWVKQGTDAGVPWNMPTGGCTTRRYGIAMVATELAPLGDNVARRLLWDVLGEDRAPTSFPVGAVLGGMTIDEARAAYKAATT